jgi:hypothetical protein
VGVPCSRRALTLLTRHFLWGCNPHAPPGGLRPRTPVVVRVQLPCNFASPDLVLPRLLLRLLPRLPDHGVHALRDGLTPLLAGMEVNPGCAGRGVPHAVHQFPQRRPGLGREGVARVPEVVQVQVRDARRLSRLVPYRVKVLPGWPSTQSGATVSRPLQVPGRCPTAHSKRLDTP